jgi:hypothetical protein
MPCVSHVETAFSLHRLYNDCGNLAWVCRSGQHEVDRAQRVVDRNAERAVGKRNMKHVRQGRAELPLVGDDLARQGGRQRRPAMKPAGETDDRLPARHRAGDLDGILDRLGARREQDGLRTARKRGEGVEALGELHVAFVAHHLERGMREAVELFADGRNDARVAMADVQNGDPRSEVDVSPSFGVPYLGVKRAFGEDGRRARNAPRHGSLATAAKICIFGHGAPRIFWRRLEGTAPNLGSGQLAVGWC